MRDDVEIGGMVIYEITCKKYIKAINYYSKVAYLLKAAYLYIGGEGVKIKTERWCKDY
jgi:hypothetical protein